MSTISTISPEGFDVANGYLLYGSIDDTAEQMQIAKHEVVRVLNTPEVKRYIDGVLLDMGYRNKGKLGKLLDKMIDAKVEEAEESGMYTSKDLLELMQFAHKMRMDEIKALKEAGPATAVQINNQYGDSNMGRLMEKLLS